MEYAGDVITNKDTSNKNLLTLRIRDWHTLSKPTCCWTILISSWYCQCWWWQIWYTSSCKYCIQPTERERKRHYYTSESWTIWRDEVASSSLMSVHLSVFTCLYMVGCSIGNEADTFKNRVTFELRRGLCALGNEDRTGRLYFRCLSVIHRQVRSSYSFICHYISHGTQNHSLSPSPAYLSS